MLKELGPGLRFTLIFTVLTGLLYPGVVTGLCQALFNRQANGSVIAVKGREVGSTLIGQNFARPEYFHPRPSAAGDKGYDALASGGGGSNLGPTSQKLIDRVKASVADIRKEDPAITGNLPADMVTASASGLDPHISPAAAEVQAARVAQTRHVDAARIRTLIEAHTAGPDLGFLGEPRVNVLELNLALDEQLPRR
jgi:K+-transporting ATPase ATPase C chain